MMERTYVALDLEMTGLDPLEDEIIEIGAVKFRGQEVLETYAQLVKPRRSLPLKITRLTGITAEEIASAPPFHAVVSDLVRFMSDHPIVGHSVDHDLEMLRNNGMNFGQPVYDTFPLSTLLLPGLSAYKLNALAGKLGIPHPDAHRAFNDADVTRQVFLQLLAKIATLNVGELDDLSYLLERSEWPLSDLFEHIKRQKAQHAFDPAAPHPTKARRPPHAGEGTLGPLWEGSDAAQPTGPESEKTLKLTGDTTPLALEAIDAFFASDGPMGQAFANYDRREPQVQMARAVAETFNTSDALLVEAGTGTGKSMAYLVPAAMFAARRGERVVISTNTINLQDQLFNKDIPDLQRVMQTDPTAPPFQAALLKGRSNYLCLRRYKQLQRDETVKPEEARILLKIHFWLAEGASGDGGDLMLHERERFAWSKVNVPADTCTGRRCPDFHDCFFFKARRRAETVHIVVVNHALLLSDLVADFNVLPPYDHVVIDEAHNLEDVATDQFSFTLDQAALLQYLDLLFQMGGSRTIGGLLSELPVYFQDSAVGKDDLERANQIIKDLHPTLEKARESVEAFFKVLDTFVQREIEHDNSYASESMYDLRLRVTPAVRQRNFWGSVEESWANLNTSLEYLREGIGRIETLLVDVEQARMENYDELLLRVQSLKRLFTDVCIQTGHIITGDENNIYWINQNHTSGALTLRAAPLDVSELLQAQLFAQKQTIILTSATLSINESLDFVKSRLGLPEPQELLLESPFDYEQQAMIYIPNDMPEPNQRGYQKKVEEALIALCTAMEGRTLALFTANSALRKTMVGIQEVLEDEDIIVLGQGLDGSRRTLLERFKESPRTVLLGTTSFWEGVDVVGDALSALVITKLPFSVPSDPIIAARSEQFTDPFSQYTIPQSILRFKQGFGRLIRSRHDRGVVVVLDRRLLSKRYGALFLQSLPTTTVRQGPLKQLPRLAARFLP